MNTVFDREDFSLCHVPVPKGYLQSQTHCGIALYQGRYYLTTSPYPSFQEKKLLAYFKALIRRVSGGRLFKTTRPEAFENPCLYIGIIEEHKPPTQFKLMQERPLMETPESYYGLPAFNSDPDIFIENSQIYVLNRPVYRTKMCVGELLNKYENRLYFISGDIDCERFKLDKILRLYSTETRMLASPCFIKYKGNYHIFELETNAYIDGIGFDGLYCVTAESIRGLKNNDNWQRICVESENYIPWHMSLFQYKEKLYSVVACVKRGAKQHCWQMLGEFNEDISKLTVYQTPLTDYNSYRGSACVTNDGEFILYNTTVHEKIPGSKSVDGRDVIMAHAQFEDVLKKLKENG